MGFTVGQGVDAATGRRYAMAVSELNPHPRAWGLYLVDLSQPPALCVAVPHTASDENCEKLALRLWRSVPGTVLALAAVHRAKEDPCDVEGSVFHQFWAKVVGPRGVPQIQIHGAKNTTDPSSDFSVSTGLGRCTRFAVGVVESLDGPRTSCWYEDGTWGAHVVNVNLRARKNVQGIAAQKNGWSWVSIEISADVRKDVPIDPETPARWEVAVDRLAAGNPTQLGVDRPASAGSALPSALGSPRSGSSRFFSREDHVHRHYTAPPECGYGGPDIWFDATEGDHLVFVLTPGSHFNPPLHGYRAQRILAEGVNLLDQPAVIHLHGLLLPVGGSSTVTVQPGKRWIGELVFLTTAGDGVATDSWALLRSWTEQ